MTKSLLRAVGSPSSRPCACVPAGRGGVPAPSPEPGLVDRAMIPEAPAATRRRRVSLLVRGDVAVPV
ncbi:MAG TPA: hypothetical protein VFI22_10085, partial [Thermomicrobiales bacterium]|nr:hypothetical protein [Thermomicrobiales bacterium]